MDVTLFTLGTFALVIGGSSWLGLSQSFGVHGPLDMSANVAASGSEGLFGGAHAARMLNEP